MTETRPTIQEALDDWTLTKGTVGNVTSKEACAVSLPAWVKTGVLTDHPECAHPTLAPLVIEAFDAADTTDKEGVTLTLTAHDLLLDTWWVPSSAIVLALAYVDADLRPFDRTMTILSSVKRWNEEGRPVINLSEANLSGANLSGAYLYRANLSGANGTPASGMPTGWKLNDARLWVMA